MRPAEKIVRSLLEGEPSDLDLACDFIEEELGRFDWINNWPNFKAKHDAVLEIRSWLLRTGSRGDAQAIFNYIEELVKRGGRYR